MSATRERRRRAARGPTCVRPGGSLYVESGPPRAPSVDGARVLPPAKLFHRPRADRCGVSRRRSGGWALRSDPGPAKVLKAIAPRLVSQQRGILTGPGLRPGTTPGRSRGWALWSDPGPVRRLNTHALSISREMSCFLSKRWRSRRFMPANFAAWVTLPAARSSTPAQ